MIKLADITKWIFLDCMNVLGHRGLMVMALDCGAGGHEFQTPSFPKNIFDLMERFDEMV